MQPRGPASSRARLPRPLYIQTSPNGNSPMPRYIITVRQRSLGRVDGVAHNRTSRSLDGRPTNDPKESSPRRFGFDHTSNVENCITVSAKSECQIMHVIGGGLLFATMSRGPQLAPSTSGADMGRTSARIQTWRFRSGIVEVGNDAGAL